MLRNRCCCFFFRLQAPAAAQGVRAGKLEIREDANRSACTQPYQPVPQEDSGKGYQARIAFEGCPVLRQAFNGAGPKRISKGEKGAARGLAKELRRNQVT